MSTDYNELLSELNTLYKDKTHDVYVPTLQKSVQYVPINVKQQKQLVKTIGDVQFGGLQFTITVNDILIDNCAEEFKDQLTLVDKACILVTLKRYISKVIKTDIEGDEYIVDLIKHVKTFPKQKINSTKLSKVIKVGNVQLDCSVPTLLKENKINKDVYKILKKNQSDDDNAFDLVGELFVYELVKYIDAIKLEDKSLDLNELTFTQRISLLERLPMEVSDKIISFVNDIKKYDEHYLTHIISDDVKIEIPTTVALFTTD